MATIGRAPSQSGWLLSMLDWTDVCHAVPGVRCSLFAGRWSLVAGRWSWSLVAVGIELGRCLGMDDDVGGGGGLRNGSHEGRGLWPWNFWRGHHRSLITEYYFIITGITYVYDDYDDYFITHDRKKGAPSQRKHPSFLLVPPSPSPNASPPFPPSFSPPPPSSHLGPPHPNPTPFPL